MNIALNVFDFSLFKKIERIVKNGETIFDFTKPIIQNVNNIRETGELVLVTKEFVARPDLISKILYGTEEFSDALMYYNGIGSYVAVVEGMILRVPTTESIKSEAKKGNVKKENQSKVELNKKLPKKDKNRILAKSESGEVKTTNMTAAGSTPSIANNGVIELGTNVIPKKCKDDLSASQLASEQIKKAIKLKLKGIPTTIQNVNNKELIKAVDNQLSFNNAAISAFK